MIYEPTILIPCTTPIGDGYVWYIKTNGFLENDEVAVILTDGGLVKHFTTDQIRILRNETYGIKKAPNNGGS